MDDLVNTLLSIAAFVCFQPNSKDHFADAESISPFDAQICSLVCLCLCVFVSVCLFIGLCL